MMRSVIFVAAIVAVSVALPVVHQLSGPEIPANRTCTESATKCAGAPNRPLVPYAPCCDSGMVCGVPITPVGNSWGSYCLPAALVSSVTPPAAAASMAPPTGAPSAATTAAPAMAATTAAAGRAGNASTAAGTSASTNTSDSEPAAGTTASPSPASTSDNKSKCFPAAATVELENGGVVSMDKLSIGDMVKVGPNAFSKVFMFTHKMQSGDHEFVKITTASGASISLTGGHYITVDGTLVAASQVATGATLQLGSGITDQVKSVETVVGTGLYNPQTLQGDIVVNGVVASTYTTAVEPRFAHAILSPFRSLSTLLGVDFTFLESGGGHFAEVAPRGSLVF